MRVIGTVIPAIADSCSFYRGMGPLGEIARKSDIMIHSMEKFHWASMSQISLLFMQRPYTENHKEIMEQALFNNIPIWVDFDDLLFDVPTDNPNWFTYQKKSNVEAVKFCMENADVISVSTNYLGEQISRWNKNVVVIPNAMDVDRYPYRGHMEVGKMSRSFFWRGSRTHLRDLMTYADPIIEAGPLNDAWKYHFIGDNAWPITDRMRDDQCYVMDAMGIEEYMMHIWRIAPSCGLVPLHDSAFNRSKSNIAWMESVFAGAIAIAPNWEEWAHPGTLLYTDQKSFHEAMKVVINEEIDVHKVNKQAWEYICDTLALSKVNNARRQIIEKLMSR